MHKGWWAFLIVVLILGFVGFGVIFLAGTRTGSVWLTNVAMKFVVPAQEQEIGQIKGTLVDGLVYRDVVLEDLPGLPPEARLRIQKLSVQFDGWDVRSLRVIVDNARLQLPFSDPLMLWGSLDNGRISANLYSNSISTSGVFRFFHLSKFEKFNGSVRDLDIRAEGPLKQLDISGGVYVERLQHPRFLLEQVPVQLALTFKNQRPSGTVYLESGQAVTKHIRWDIQKSRILLTDDLKNPGLDIQVRTRVQNVKITARVEGTRKNPKVRLTSSPSYSEGKLMVMLLTGKSWDALEHSIDEGTLSSDLAPALLDYFVFGGRAGEIADKFGIKDVSVTYTGEKKGVGITTAVTGNIDVGYQVQTTTPSDNPTVSRTNELEHKLETEVKVNKNLSVVVEKELRTGTSNDQQTVNEPVPDDRVLFKFKKEF